MKPNERWDSLKKEYKEQLEQNIVEEVEQPIPMTEEDKLKFKKQLIILVWIIIIFIIGLIMYNVFINKSENIKYNEKEIQEEVIEPIPEGDISITNESIQQIHEMLNFNINNPLYEDNILKLFKEEKVNIKEMDFQTKMFLITSHKYFKEYMLKDTNLKNYKDEQVSITKKEIDELAKQILGPEITLEHENFKYFYEEGNQVIYFDVILENDKYILKETIGRPSSFTVFLNLYYAYKIDVELRLRYHVLFLNSNGIYQDEDMKILISKDVDNVNQYFNKSKNYNFKYIESDMSTYYIDDFGVATHQINKEKNEYEK